MPPTETPETVDQSAEPQSDLWTSDSERGTGTTDALPSGAIDTDTAESTPEPAAAATDAAASAGERDDKGQFKPKGKGKPRTDPQARVEQATAREAAAKEDARQAREEAARYRAELDAARRPASSPPSQSAVAPASASAGGDFPEFEPWSQATGNSDWNAYNRALARHEAGQIVQQYQTQQRNQTRVATYQQRVQEGLTRYPDLAPMLAPGARTAFDDSLARRGMAQVPPIIAEAVVDSELAPEILRFFGTHPEDGAQLIAEVASLPVTAAPMVRRLLEQSVASQAVARPDSAAGVRPSAAKPPVNRVGGTATTTPTDPDDMDFGPDFIRAENAREKKRQEARRW